MRFLRPGVIAVVIARFVLRNHGRQVWLGGKRVIVGDVRRRQQRQKPRYYNEAVGEQLIQLWELLNYQIFQPDLPIPCVWLDGSPTPTNAEELRGCICWDQNSRVCG